MLVDPVQYQFGGVRFVMEVTLGNTLVGAIVAFVGVLAKAAADKILAELRTLNKRGEWLDKMIKRYPNPEVLFPRLNGHYDADKDGG